jgi:phosphate transport system substrate-binding protein
MARAGRFAAGRWSSAVIILIFLAGCAPQTQTAAGAPRDGMQLRGAGATFPSLLYTQWFAAYQHDHPQPGISYDAVGSGEGVRRFVGRNIKESEQIDFGASDAAMTDEQIAQVPGGALLLPVTGGCVTLSYNIPGFPGELRLSRRAYAAIFLGRVSNWNDPIIAEANPGLAFPDLSLVTVVRQDASGTTYAFTKNLDAISDVWQSHYGAANIVNWPGNAMRAEGNEGVAGRILHSEGSIGYIGYEFAHRLGLRMALVENKSGRFVKPGEESCTAALASADMPDNLRVYVPDPAAAGAYPIVTFSWILLYKNYSPGKASALHDLFAWCLRGGQDYAPQLGYIRLPDNVASKALAALDANLH